MGTQAYPQCVGTFNELENLHLSPVKCELLVRFGKGDNVLG